MAQPAAPAKKAQSNFLLDFALGGTSAAIAKTACAPIERVKLLLQNRPGVYKSVSDCFIRVNAEQGFNSFWRGNLANVIRYFPTQAMNFAFKDQFKKIFNPYNAKKEPGMFFIGNMMSGGMAGAFSLSVVYSLDFARTRLATDQGKGDQREFNGLVDCLKKIYLKEGIVGLYRGFAISVVGIFIYRACYFGMYDTGKVTLLSRDSSLLLKWAFAQIVTIVASTACYPIDTIRRRMMMQSGKKTVEYTSSLGCARWILANEGTQGFFKGCLANVYRATAGALVLVLNGELQKIFGIEGDLGSG